MVTTPRKSPPRSALNETVEPRLRNFEEQRKADPEFLSDAGKIINHRAFEVLNSLGSMKREH